MGRSSRPIIFSKVVLPQPEGPIMMTNSPRLTEREKSESAKYSDEPKPNDLLRFLSSMRERRRGNLDDDASINIAIII